MWWTLRHILCYLYPVACVIAAYLGQDPVVISVKCPYWLQNVSLIKSSLWTFWPLQSVCAKIAHNTNKNDIGKCYTEWDEFNPFAQLQGLKAYILELWVYCESWILVQRCHPVIECDVELTYYAACWIYSFVSSLKFLFSAQGKLNKYKTSKDQQFIIESVIIDLFCCSRFPVDSFTDVSVTMVVYGENAFRATSGFIYFFKFLLQYFKWPLGKIGYMQHFIQFL